LSLPPSASADLIETARGWVFTPGSPLAGLAVLALLLLAGLALFFVLKTARERSQALLRLARMEERARAGEARISELAQEAGRTEVALSALRLERDTLDRALVAERADARARERQIADLKEAKEQMRQAFHENAGALMASHSETFKTENKIQIDALLAPLKNDIDAFKRSLMDAHVESAKQHGSLKSQIEQLSLRSAEVSRETVALTRALKGNVQKQGAWGEMIVDTILNRLGLREGEEYSRQESFSDAGGRVRTDYIVNMPNGERLIIDAKVSLIDFERAVNAEDDALRAAALAGHVQSMRGHIASLAARDYAARVGTRIDFVIMFVPIEGALDAALKHDERLLHDALDRGVAFATPTTLATQMMTVRAMWRMERRNQYAEDIAARAGALYDKFCGFVGDLSVVGDRLGQLDAAYQGAMKKLASGKGNLVGQVEKLKAMGAATNKGLPKDLLERAGAEGDPPLLIADASDAPRVQ
jgi:DNA recombination protein RmuC